MSNALVFDPALEPYAVIFLEEGLYDAVSVASLRDGDTVLQRIPDAAQEVVFQVTGPGKILGIGNADVNSVEDCKTNRHHTYQGRGLAILQTAPSAGEITVNASAPGLEPAAVTLQSR